ncbi:Uncharacterized damage-inducible protein DinB (forms a four-helix bundle) [Mucilaginibacter pineti]|uniref:Uncharacterized damage-inducible protein DinB (Forms a four-helix bundle) n=2 Tax=Mucilaginibacter pineti TaxID=1391627 RepID=A0A1G6THX4_9SPHI|nr:Uncharacterized damage-inducible protein DinB (forms a four-helix bundle) [Mucilaginibacter pineti]
MKTHFIKMLNYDYFANKLLLQAIVESKIQHRPIQLMAHLLMAERRWLDRCNEIEPYPNDLWPTDFTTERLAHLIEEYHEEWINFVDKLNDNDFDKIISYQNSAGESYQTQLSDIITHLINHGTHTRAQAGQQLKLAGAQTLPITDYSYYLRQLNR